MQPAMRSLIVAALASGTPLLLLAATVKSADAAELLIGAATTSITPDKPVALSGQFHTRISQKVETPVTATALALESRDGDQAELSTGSTRRLRQKLAPHTSPALGAPPTAANGMTTSADHESFPICVALCQTRSAPGSLLACSSIKAPRQFTTNCHPCRSDPAGWRWISMLSSRHASSKRPLVSPATIWSGCGSGMTIAT